MTAEARAGPVSLPRSAAGEPQPEPVRRPKPARAARATSRRRPRPARGQWHGACSLPAWGLLSSPCLRQPCGWPGARMRPGRTSVGGSTVRRMAATRAGSGCPRDPSELELLPSPWPTGARRALPCPRQQLPAPGGSSQPGRAGVGSLPRVRGSAGTLLSWSRGDRNRHQETLLLF